MTASSPSLPIRQAITQPTTAVSSTKHSSTPITTTKHPCHRLIGDIDLKNVNWSRNIEPVASQIIARLNGQDQSAACFSVDQRSFNELEPYLQNRALSDVLQWQYDPPAETLELSMPPSHLHETVRSDFELLMRIKLLQNPEKFNRVKVSGTVKLPYKETLTGKLVARCPDISFHHGGSEFPGVVVEIANTQTEEDLKVCAHDYIKGSHGRVRVVIGIKIKAENERISEMRLNVWRAHAQKNLNRRDTLQVKTELKDEIIWERKQSQGTLQDSERILLHLKWEDFCFESLNSPDSGISVIVTAAELSDFAATVVRWTDDQADRPTPDTPLDLEREPSVSPSEPSDSDTPSPPPTKGGRKSDDESYQPSPTESSGPLALQRVSRSKT